MDALSTIGYEGATLDDFLATLQRHGVTTLVDVREAPISRRREFAKRALADALSDAGIAYRHEGALGAPKPLRDRVKQGACTPETFFADTPSTWPVKRSDWSDWSAWSRRSTVMPRCCATSATCATATASWLRARSRHAPA